MTSRSNNVVTALVHLYRAEVGRMTAYRARLDTTTNWAITSSALVGTFAFGSVEISHVAFLFLMLLNYFFLILEARRFIHYEASRLLVRVMERSFYPEILDQTVDPKWQDELLDMLRNPRPPVGRYDAMGWRLRRNYLWIYLVILLSWVIKLELSGGTIGDPVTLVARASIGSLPGWLIWLAVGGFYAGLIGLTFNAQRRYPLFEDW